MALLNLTGMEQHLKHGWDLNRLPVSRRCGLGREKVHEALTHTIYWAIVPILKNT